MSNEGDNSVLGRAKAEGEAEAKARRRRMTRAGAEPSIRSLARSSAKMVFNSAKEVGAPLEPMKARMAKWVQIVENYEKDIAQVKADKTIASGDRDRLLRAMLASRAELYTEIFG